MRHASAARRAVVTGLVAASLAGCFGDGSSAPLVLPEPPAGAVPGGELTVGIVSPLSVDPALVQPDDVGGTTVVRTMCDSVLAHDPRTAELVPALAEQWRVLDGGERLSLRLRGDARFSDGSRVEARDVALSLARVASPDTVSPVADLLEDVAGYADLRDRKVERDELAGVQVVSARDLEVVLLRRDAQWVNLLATSVGVVVPADAAEDADFSARPVCAGPYRLAEPWSAGQPTITLERTDAYYAGVGGLTRGGAGYADTITFKLYADRAKAQAALARGEVDVAPVTAGDVSGAVAESTSTGVLEYVGLPTATEPFDDPVVRRALSQALDRRRIAEVVYAGRREPATALLPPTLPDALVDGSVCAGAAPAAGDRDAARASLAAAGVSLSDVTAPLYFNDEFANEALITEVAAQWRAVLGLRTRLVPLAFDAYLTRGSGGTGFDGPFRLAHVAPYPNAGEVLGPLFSSDEIGTRNLSRFSSQRFDRDLRRDARQAIAVEDQREEYAALHQLLCTQLPVIPVVHGTASYALDTDHASAAGRLLDRATAQPLLREVYER